MGAQDNLQPQMLRQTIPFIVLATLAVLGRYCSRKLRQAALGLDDLVILFALVSTPDFCSIILDIHADLCLGIHLGQFRHGCHWYCTPHPATQNNPESHNLDIPIGVGKHSESRSELDITRYYKVCTP